eukprot:m.329196 g.329196  ORF g.329196 m.329196 type:complete len:226 (-) comp16502_c2_seq1:370-1047(-)
MDFFVVNCEGASTPFKKTALFSRHRATTPAAARSPLWIRRAAVSSETHERRCDGKILAVASEPQMCAKYHKDRPEWVPKAVAYDKMIALVDPFTGSLIRHIPFHPTKDTLMPPCLVVKFSPDGTMLAAARGRDVCMLAIDFEVCAFRIAANGDIASAKSLYKGRSSRGQFLQVTDDAGRTVGQIALEKGHHKLAKFCELDVHPRSFLETLGHLHLDRFLDWDNFR